MQDCLILTVGMVLFLSLGLIVQYNGTEYRKDKKGIIE